MRVLLNGNPYETCSATVTGVLRELALDDAVVATAVNGQFVARAARSASVLNAGDAIEIVAPMQGG
jgi:sulfur carrier protein